MKKNDFHDRLDKLRREMIETALRETSYQYRAAHRLGLHVNTMRFWMRRLGIGSGREEGNTRGKLPS
jgi:transcriptional regulator with GAF, ATPase, and Fis domain